MNRKLFLIGIIPLFASGLSFASLIEASDAGRIAFGHAGTDASDVRGLETRLGRKAGYPVYEVEFRTSEGKYEYEVLAQDGRIVSFEFDMDDDALMSLYGQSVSGLDKTSALLIAVESAGLGMDDVVSRKVEYEKDRNGGHYDVEFSDGTYKWDFEIGADGKILEGGYELKSKGLPSMSSRTISRTDVERIVTDLLGGPVSDLSFHSDYDDGHRVFKVHADKDGLAYEAVLDASYGTVYSLDWEAVAM